MIKIYADGASDTGMLELTNFPVIKGFTTNPTLMRQAGITKYDGFIRTVIPDLKKYRPDTNISLEVISDNWLDMSRQAHVLHSFSKEYDYPIYIKIPVMTTNGKPTYDLVKGLHDEGMLINITAVFTEVQGYNVLNALRNNDKTPSIISIFAGRIADTQVDPEPTVKEIVRYRSEFGLAGPQILWASTREIFNIVQAEYCGCDIITVTHEQLKKLSLEHKDLTEYSRETVQMFYNDAVASGFTL